MKKNLVYCLFFLIGNIAISQTNYDYNKYRLHYNKATLSVAKNNLKEACVEYEEAFKHGNQYLPDNLHLEEYASCLLSLGDTVASLEILKKAIIKGSDIEYIGIANKLSKKHLDLLKQEAPVLKLEFWKTKIGDIENIIEISKLEAIDQSIRNNFGNAPSNLFNRLYQITDSVNFIQLKLLVTEKGANPAGLLMLHLYDDNQKYVPFYDSILKREIYEGKISPEFYVFWYDRQRIYVEQKTTQKYGEYNLFSRGENNYSPNSNPIDDIENVDKRRAELGLMPLEDYAIIQKGELPESYKKMKKEQKSK